MLLNPVTEDEAEMYLLSPLWVMQEKLDGRRVMVRCVNRRIVAANKLGQSVPLVANVGLELADISRTDWILDGELIGDVYHVFDCANSEGVNLTARPYAERLAELKHLLKDLDGKHVKIAATYGNADKQRMFAQFKKEGREGVVFKCATSPYTVGRPNKGGTAIKCKFWASCSCIVLSVNAKRSVEVGIYYGDAVMNPLGNVSVPVNYTVPKVGDVVEVRYLYVAGNGGSLYQPIYLGVRDDVAASECHVKNQKLKYKRESED